MEIVSLGEKTYYIPNRTNIGIYKINETDVYLIDTGMDSDTGKKILKTIEEKNWKIVGIINTHSHADHIGGNKVIEERSACKIFSYGLENIFINHTELESIFLYGAHPFIEIQNKFLYAKKSHAVSIEENLPDGLEWFSLKGHSYDMIGIKTSDDVYFLGDALVSEETINKYAIFYLYDIKEHLKTLEYLKTQKGKIFLCSHVEPLKDIHSLILKNEAKMKEIMDLLLEIGKSKKTMEEILKEIMDHYHLTLNENQYLIVGSTLKSYLSYLKEEGKINDVFEENKMLWRSYE